jgi:hypothetical protein
MKYMCMPGREPPVMNLGDYVAYGDRDPMLAGLVDRGFVSTAPTQLRGLLAWLQCCGFQVLEWTHPPHGRVWLLVRDVRRTYEECSRLDALLCAVGVDVRSAGGRFEIECRIDPAYGAAIIELGGVTTEDLDLPGGVRLEVD